MNSSSSSQIQYEKVKQLIDFVGQKGTQFSEVFQYLAGDTASRVANVYGGAAAETFNTKLKTIAEKTEELLRSLVTSISEEFNFNLEEYKKLNAHLESNVQNLN